MLALVTGENSMRVPVHSEGRDGAPGLLHSPARTWELQTHQGLFSEIQVSLMVEEGRQYLGLHNNRSHTTCLGTSPGQGEWDDDLYKRHLFNCYFLTGICKACPGQRTAFLFLLTVFSNSRMEDIAEAKNEIPETLNVREEERGTGTKDKVRFQINQTVNSLGKQTTHRILLC